MRGQVGVSLMAPRTRYQKGEMGRPYMFKLVEKNCAMPPKIMTTATTMLTIRLREKAPC
jgi:hypothetical protein